MKQFMMLMQPQIDESKDSPETLQKRMEEAMAWAGEQIAKGVVQSGNPLAPEGRLLKSKDEVLSDGPFLEVKEIIAGYFILQAEDIEAATNIASTCPLLQHCHIQIRPFLTPPADG